MDPRIYTYKVTFEETPDWYWGAHKEKKHGEPYLGSPTTHAWKWEFYTPCLEILELFPYTDEGWEEARKVEDRCILPDLNKPLCLNEHVGGLMSLEASRRGAAILHEEKDDSGRSVHALKTLVSLNEEKDNLGRSIHAMKAHKEKDDLGRSITAVKAGTASHKEKDDQGRSIRAMELNKEKDEFGRSVNAVKAGKKGGKVKNKNIDKCKEGGRKGGATTGAKAQKERIGFFGLPEEEKLQHRKKGGEKNVQTGQIHKIRTPESCRKGGEIAGKMNSHHITKDLWRCTVCGAVSTAAGLTHIQRAKGIEKNHRERVYPPDQRV